MKALRLVLTLMAVTLPVHHAAAQGKAPGSMKMTPEQRNAAQARLNQQAALLTPQSLDAAKAQLRSAMIIMRDSLGTAAGTAALITRAQATKSSGVELSQARRLRGQCATAQRTAATTLTRIASLNTSNPKGVKLLADYRTAITEAGRLAGECDKALATAFATPAPAIAKITTAVASVNRAATIHDQAFNDIAVGMEITIRP